MFILFRRHIAFQNISLILVPVLVEKNNLQSSMPFERHVVPVAPVAQLVTSKPSDTLGHEFESW